MDQLVWAVVGTKTYFERISTSRHWFDALVSASWWEMLQNKSQDITQAPVTYIVAPVEKRKSPNDSFLSGSLSKHVDLINPPFKSVQIYD